MASFLLPYLFCKLIQYYAFLASLKELIQKRLISDCFLIVQEMYFLLDQITHKVIYNKIGKLISSKFLNFFLLPHFSFILFIFILNLSHYWFLFHYNVYSENSP